VVIVKDAGIIRGGVFRESGTDIHRRCRDKMKMNAVVAYIQQTEDGRTTLTFDDVSSEAQPPTLWCREALFTSNSYDSEAMKNLNLTKKQYAEIGENLVMRLLALGARGNGAL
jgi:hypothetical protein